MGNDITELQTIGLKLSQHFDLVYIHGPHQSESAAAKGLEFFSNGPWYKWRSNDDEGDYDASLQYLANYCCKEAEAEKNDDRSSAPFDGVYAFSDGVRVVTMLSQLYTKFGLKSCPWKF